MFTERFLDLITNNFDLDISGDNFSTDRLPEHERNAIAVMVREIGSNVYKKFTKHKELTPSNVSNNGDGTVEMTFDDNSIFELDDIVYLEKEDGYDPTGIVTAVDIEGGSNVTILTSYDAQYSSLEVRTGLRYNLELAGAYIMASIMGSTLFNMSSHGGLSMQQSFGESSYSTVFNSAMELANHFKTKASSLMYPFMDDTYEDSSGFDIEFI